MTGGNFPTPPWADDLERKLRRMWADGDSASIIGKVIGKTRNAVIGKVHRLGLEKRRLVRSKVGRPLGWRPMMKPKNAVKVHQPRSKKSVPPTHVSSTETEIVPLNGDGITLMEMSWQQCHAIIKDGSRRSNELARYCGQPVKEGFAYCEGHYDAFHRVDLRR